MTYKYIDMKNITPRKSKWYKPYLLPVTTGLIIGLIIINIEFFIKLLAFFVLFGVSAVLILWIIGLIALLLLAWAASKTL